MRLTRVKVDGYKRLVGTSCNVDGRLVAFLGPNEAGKSSVLEALAWFSDEDAPLDGPLRSRALPAVSDEHEVVTVRYELDDRDREALQDIESDTHVRTLEVSKRAGGALTYRLDPRPTRREARLSAARAALAELEVHRSEALQDPEIGAWFGAIASALEDSERTAGAETVAAFEELAAWLRQPPPTPEDDSAPPRRVVEQEDAVPAVDQNEQVASALTDALALLRQRPAAEQAWQVLDARRPVILLFDDDDRAVKSTYNLTAGIPDDQVPAALGHLFRIAQVRWSELQAAQTSKDTSRIQSLLKRVNRRLEERLSPTWRQSRLTVMLNIEGATLQVLIDEVTADGARTDIAERSDGLRMFLSLVAFLADREAEEDVVAPVLLIDEAETHLHYDAQADLIDVLLNHVQASQVFYTTHSPGCLPPDLGTGIRLVAPSASKPGTSELRADFWDGEQPGFAPLLFAMGAGAAAFSACRRALLAEGVSDMLLLPTLLRMATGLPDLDFQVAPGLSNRLSSVLAADVAANVAYLVDGDGGGTTLKKRLVGAGVPAGQVFSLPPGQALEDLVAPEVYLDAVRRVLAASGSDEAPASEDLSGSGPIAKRVEDWAKSTGRKIPSKKVVASLLAREPETIRLADGAEAVLQRLHQDIRSALRTSY